ncbi:hypothetical protein D3227_32320 [Mesorhizobium waimense]|uniref:Uncharacterized protein n=1 Tax=Mesorhizobium waimense TaxID=1300307 RepID=A0A3A5K960_9HYPH|nr:hypothetical protein D3227_32320 [Mesorhizobium waimense]
MPASRDLLPTRSDRLQQFALTGVSISKNGHNHHRQDFGVRVQWVEMLIRADLIEHAFANSQIVRAEAGAIETPTQHLRVPFRAHRPCMRRAFADEAMDRLRDNIVRSVLESVYSLPDDCSVKSPKISAHSRALY